MPFKANKSTVDLNKRLTSKVENALPHKIWLGLYKMYQVLGPIADKYVPIDTWDLIKSRDMRIEREGDKFIMTYGYYKEYAVWLHESFNWSNRRPGERGKPKSHDWNPKGTPKWLDKAWREGGTHARKSFEGEL